MRILTTIILGAQIVLGQNVPNPQLAKGPCGNFAVRKEVKKLTPTEWNNFVAASQELHKRGWLEGLSKIHNDFAMAVHGNGLFLPWHRRFVRHVESLLQSIDPSIVIPYWDWTEDWQNPEKNRVLSDSMFGGNGVGGQSCVENGFEKGWKKSYPSDGCVVRKYKQGSSPGPFWPMDALVKTIETQTTFASFSPSIENGSHGVVHIGIGGDFLEMWAPNDILFFMHHSMVDRLWSIWQERDHKRYYDVASNDINGKPIDRDTPLPFYNEPVGSAISMRSAGYCYLYDNFAESAFNQNKRVLGQNRTRVAGQNRKKLPVPQLRMSASTSMFNFDPKEVERMNALVKSVVEEMELYE
ncbi:hypothetical protein BB559_001916 [Furculomyces boomerangus]|uniref:Tyrosinase copper-binding domain-containing protein n=1 Tax=Furculomyces boomerangus TaxID=61424 RepID=A0A2T9YZI7_9FUNG|nr:hypothetical protein BB559_001916 [Furculomyces boomerangus]